MTKPTIWEVWLAKVFFDDGSDMKKRPVIIIDENSDCITAIELTTRPPKYAGEFILSDWMRVGLKYQSTVKIDSIVYLSRQELIHKIGDLGLADIRHILSYTYIPEPQQPQQPQPQQPQRTKPQRASKKHGCYIATSVYGSYDCPQVLLLRRFRDEKLARTCMGRGFIRFYYLISPTIVRRFGKKKWFNRLWRKILDMMIYKLQVKDGANTTDKEDQHREIL